MVNLDMLYKWTFHNFALEELTYFTLKHFFFNSKHLLFKKRCSLSDIGSFNVTYRFSISPVGHFVLD